MPPPAWADDPNQRQGLRRAMARARPDNEMLGGSKTRCGIVLLWLVKAVAIGSVGCSQSDFGNVGGDANDGPGRPGDDGWREDDVSCIVDDDCLTGEACIDSICQMARCKDGPYVSNPPLGVAAAFFRDHEILAVDTQSYEGAYWVDGYKPTGGSGIDYPGSWNAGGEPIADVAGGNLYGKRPEIFAVAIKGQKRVQLDEGKDEVDVGFAPRAIDVGDVDGDGVDELVAINSNGKVTACNVDEQPKRCEGRDYGDGAEGIDVAVADVDKDGLDEPVFLIKKGGTTRFHVWNNAAGDAKPEDQRDYADPAGHKIHRIGAGDIDGDAKAELIAFRDDDFGFWAHAKLFIYGFGNDSVNERGVHEVHDSTMDLAVADLDRDNKAEVVTVRSNGEVEVLRANGSNDLKMSFAKQLQVTVSPNRIGLTDFDNDSPGGRLSSGPELFAGPVVPTVAMVFPPYDAERSDGLPSVLVGDNEIQAESTTETVSLSLGFDVGVSAGFLDIFKAGVSTSVRKQLEKSVMNETRMNIGDRLTGTPDIDRLGRDYGLVVLSAGCFHAYTYDVEDPAAVLGDQVEGEQMQVLVPVAGATTMWSTTRYNAMARAVGGLPIIEPGYTLGDPDSYPAEPERLDGGTIADDDLLFPEPPKYVVSDAGEVGWWLSVAETETNTESMNTEVEVSASFGIGPFEFGGHLGQGWGRSHSVTVGSEALFGGVVPPVPDDPGTPEDEYTTYAYAFAPIVYRQRYSQLDTRNHWTDEPAQDVPESAFYVMTFTVNRPE